MSLTKSSKIQFKKQIVEILSSQPSTKFKSKTIARTLKVSSDDYVDFRNFLRDLSRNDVITKTGTNAYQYREKPQLVVGKLSVKTQGYGFVQLEDREIFVSQRNMTTAIDGDTVAVHLYAKSRDGKLPEGKIDHIIERKRTYIVGTYKHGKYFNFVAPDDRKIPWDIIIHDSFAKNAQPGQKVAVTLDYWEDSSLNPTGRIEEVLGFSKDPGVDVTSVAFKFNLPFKFPKKVEAECERLTGKITPSDLQGRLDFRKRVCFTIDPKDAKDFDDAVSLETLDDGNLMLGVHIADVSHYIQDGTSLDKEALSRATSVYMVDRVIPMLPEKISNEICSLRANEDRLTFSVMMKITPDGRRLDYKIQPSVINSNRRFNYEEVQKIIDDGQGDYFDELRQLRDLSQKLFSKRLKAGSLDFDLPEAKIELNDLGEPIDIRRSERLDSHHLIEEFMLLANKTISEHIAMTLTQQRQLSKLLPFIYRIHEKPDAKKITNFENLVRSLGINFQRRKRISPKQLQEVIHSVRGLPEEDIINHVMLRSLMKAKYDTKNVGHFGLAFKHYTHFTSPIRRYPDLVVHRLLKEYAEFPSEKRIAKIKSKLPEVCRISNEQEINALEAERESIKIMQAKFMVNKMGESYDGIISGIVPFGIFVEIVDYLVEGLVHIKDLAGDYYIHDEPNYRLIGQKTGKTYRLGDRVKIQVVKVVPEQKMIDFKLIEDEEE